MREASASKNERRIRAETRAYEFTINAIVCVGHVFRDLAGASVRQGPRMRTGGGGTVTPDMTLEVAAGPHAGYRAINEIKSSLPLNMAPLVEQVRRYDKDLGGGDHGAAGGGGPALHDIMVTIPLKQAPLAGRLASALRDQGVATKRLFSVLAFEHKEDGGSIFYAKKVQGRISHKKADGGLAQGLSVDPYSILDELGTTYFYDAAPPLPYLMGVLWDPVFVRLVHGKKQKLLLAGQAVPIAVEIGRLHRLASKFAPASNRNCVRRSQIKKAMDMFVRLGIATNAGEDYYELQYRMVSNVQDWLVELVAADDASEAGANGGGEGQAMPDGFPSAGGNPG